MLPSAIDRRGLIAGAAALVAAPALAQTPAPKPRVLVKTGQGLIVLELEAAKAPITVRNFLRYVEGGRFDGTTFYRAARTPGTTDQGLVEGGLQNNPEKVLRPIAHESTTMTGLAHIDGTISMAREAPGTARADFFICSGPAPSLDANPTAPGDNLGYAAFGSVVEGMDVVRAILALPTNGYARNPVMKGQILKPPVPIISMRRAS
jgi:peptidyl-prolyl cis-trans isomerase A (cyclophilin A)